VTLVGRLEDVREAHRHPAPLRRARQLLCPQFKRGIGIRPKPSGDLAIENALPHPDAESQPAIQPMDLPFRGSTSHTNQLERRDVNPGVPVPGAGPMSPRTARMRFGLSSDGAGANPEPLPTTEGATTSPTASDSHTDGVNDVEP